MRAGSGGVGIRPSVAVLPERRDGLLLGQRLGFRCRGHAGSLMLSWVVWRGRAPQRVLRPGSVFNASAGVSGTCVVQAQSLFTIVANRWTCVPRSSRHRLLFGFAKLWKFLCDMRDGAMVLTDLDAMDRSADCRRGGRVAARVSASAMRSAPASTAPESTGPEPTGPEPTGPNRLGPRTLLNLLGPNLRTYWARVRVPRKPVDIGQNGIDSPARERTHPPSPPISRSCRIKRLMPDRRRCARASPDPRW